MENTNQQKTITEETARHLANLLQKTPELAKQPMIRIRNNQIVAGVMATMGLVLFALGIEKATDNFPIFSHPIVPIIIGLVLLSTSGLLLKKLN